MTDEKTFLQQLKHDKMSAKDLAMFSMGTAIATIMPTPGDILHFYFLRWINDHRYQLSPTRYWLYNTIDYYIMDNLYWTGLFAWVLLSKRPVEEKTKIYTGVLAGGAVAGLLGKFVTDEQKHRTELAGSTGGDTSEKAMDKADYTQETQQKAGPTATQSAQTQVSAPKRVVGPIYDFEVLL